MRKDRWVTFLHLWYIEEKIVNDPLDLSEILFIVGCLRGNQRNESAKVCEDNNATNYGIKIVGKM